MLRRYPTETLPSMNLFGHIAPRVTIIVVVVEVNLYEPAGKSLIIGVANGTQKKVYIFILFIRKHAISSWH